MQFNCSVSLVLFAICSIIVICESRISLKFNLRPECRDKLPRRSYELPDVVLTGFVEQIYPNYNEGEVYSGSVIVKRVLKGPRELQGNRVTIEGFGDTNLCYSKVRKRDIWVFFLSEISNGFFRLNGTLHRINLNTMDRLNALTKDEPFRKRPEIIELPCETQYCENNGNCIEEKSAVGLLSSARCECLHTCTQSYSPVCGSNGETFANSCKIRMDSCRRSQNYFIRFLGTCEGGRRSRSVELPFHLSM
ncbi:Agrin-like protein [Leptotrombidium deliense]|uniref:Agrin-like protein n=1 Tax=Leptotrombidium deliense TaxID=299467 RepID=A0A443SBM5_9ACAR|nr:Agrin-like protein [Leptotrombidium deliense]